MLWIGITGPMGGGKSTVSGLLRARGFTVLDADEIATAVLKSGSEGEREVLAAFGGEPGVRVSGAGGSGRDGLDRRALGRAVFGDPNKLARLETIIHPRVRDEVARLKSGLEAGGARAAFYDVPLLYEKKMEDGFDAVWVVTAPVDVRRRRLVARTGLSVAEIDARFANQLPPEYKEKRAAVVLVNDGSLDVLSAAVDAALKRAGL